MRNKIKIFIITLLILFSFSTIAMSSKSFFTDVQPNKWYYEDVLSLYEKEIIHGYDDNTFRPDQLITRAEVSKMINAVLEYKSEQSNIKPQPSPVQQFDTHIVDLVAKVTPSVVQVKSTANGLQWVASGFIIKDNRILTNYHVIEDASRVEVILSNGKVYVATVLMTDTSNDIALLSIPETDQLKHLEFTKDIKQGQSIYVFGNPLGYNHSVTHGIVSHPNRQGLIQTDAAINYGNSGGVMVNINGQILGMTVSKVVGADYDNIAFGIRSNVILDFIEGRTVIYMSNKTN